MHMVQILRYRYRHSCYYRHGRLLISAYLFVCVLCSAYNAFRSDNKSHIVFLPLVLHFNMFYFFLCLNVCIRVCVQSSNNNNNKYIHIANIGILTV